VLSAVLVGGSGAGVYVHVRHALHTAFDDAHELAIRSVMETIDRGPAGFAVREHEFEEEFEELRATLGVREVAVWNAAGTKLASAGINQGAQTILARADDRAQVATPAGAVVVRRETVLSGSDGLTVVVTRDAESLNANLKTFRRGLLVFAPLAVLASLVLGWWMAGRSLRPIKRVLGQQRAFMADASHELRTPLAVIRAHAETAVDGESDEASLRRSLAVVAKSAAGLGTLVSDLMYLARSDLSTLQTVPVPVDVEEIVEETLEDFGPLAASRGSSVRFRRSGPLEAHGDPAQLKRLVAILLDNALRHGQPGDIEVSLRVKGMSVELRVEDPGPGISPDLLPRVFDRFVRGVEARSHDAGHGLGLAIAKSIVSSHRGRLSLRKNERGGTSACAIFPVIPVVSRQPELTALP